MTKQNILEKVGELEQLAETSKLSVNDLKDLTEKLKGLTFKLNDLKFKLQDSGFIDVLGLKYPNIDFKMVLSLPKMLSLLKNGEWSASGLGFDEDSQPLLAQLIEQGLVQKIWIYYDDDGYQCELYGDPEDHCKDGVCFNPYSGHAVTKEQFDLIVQPRWQASAQVKAIAEEIYYGPRPVPQDPPAFEE